MRPSHNSAGTVRRIVAAVACCALVVTGAVVTHDHPVWLHWPYASAPLTLVGARHITVERKGTKPPGACRATPNPIDSGYRCLRHGSIRVNLVTHRDDGTPARDDLESVALQSLARQLSNHNRSRLRPPVHRTYEGTLIVEVAQARSWGRGTVYSFLIDEGNTYRVACSSGEDPWSEALRRACVTFVDVDMM